MNEDPVRLAYHVTDIEYHHIFHSGDNLIPPELTILIKTKPTFLLAWFWQFSKKIIASKQSLAADKFLYSHDIGNEAVSKVLEMFWLRN